MSQMTRPEHLGAQETAQNAQAQQRKSKKGIGPGAKAPRAFSFANSNVALQLWLSNTANQHSPWSIVIVAAVWQAPRSCWCQRTLDTLPWGHGVKINDDSSLLQIPSKANQTDSQKMHCLCLRMLFDSASGTRRAVSQQVLVYIACSVMRGQVVNTTYDLRPTA